MEEEIKFEIRDLRPKGWYWTDDEFLNGYARILGTTFSMVYIDLCRHADKNQKAFPSQKKIAEEISLSEPTVNEGIKVLKYFRLIREKRIGKQCTNRYWLLGKRCWKKDFNEFEILRGKIDKVNKRNKSELKQFYDTIVPSELKQFKFSTLTVLVHNLNSLSSNSKETHSKETKKEEIAETSSASKETSSSKRKETNPAIQRLFDYFIERTKEIANFEPEIAYGKEGRLLTTRLKKYSENDIKDLIDFFLESKESEKLGCSLSIALSTWFVNKWKENKSYD